MTHTKSNIYSSSEIFGCFKFIKQLSIGVRIKLVLITECFDTWLSKVGFFSDDQGEPQ
jgi:hypothetical protein